jgi:hypothetical protein
MQNPIKGLCQLSVLVDQRVYNEHAVFAMRAVKSALMHCCYAIQLLVVVSLIIKFIIGVINMTVE